MNQMLQLTEKYSQIRCTHKNDHNGRANIGCIIYNQHCLLRVWHEPV